MNSSSRIASFLLLGVALVAYAQPPSPEALGPPPSPPGLRLPPSGSPVAPPPRTPVAPPPVAPQASEPEQQTIEQLIEHITRLKEQRAELEKQETKAVAVLKKKLEQANQKAAQFQGNQGERVLGKVERVREKAEEKRPR